MYLGLSTVGLIIAYVGLNISYVGLSAKSYVGVTKSKSYVGLLSPT